MAYTTSDLVGLSVFAKTATTTGKYYFEGEYEDKKTFQKDAEMGKLLRDSTYLNKLLVSVSDAGFGTLYYLASEVYLKDGFGSRLELGADGKTWIQISINGVPTDDDDDDQTITKPVVKSDNKGVLGGVKDVIDSANDLLKGGKKTTEPAKNNTKIINYVLGGLGALILFGGIYLLVKSGKKSDMQVATPQAEIPSPVLSGLKLRK